MTGPSVLLSAREAASLLGVDVRLLRRLAQQGDIPAARVGRQWRFRRRDLRGAAGVIAAHRSGRRQVVAALRDSEEKFRALTENSLDVIMRFDLQKRHLYVNPAVETHTGIPAGEFVGKTHAELGFPPELVELFETTLERTIDTRAVQRVEFELPNHTWMDWLLMPEFGPDGAVRAVITSSRDVTRQKAAERALREAREQLEARVAERTSELTELNRSLRHEIDERRRVEASLRDSEASLRESEKRLLTIADNIPDGMIYQLVREPEGRRRYTFLSGNVRSLHGCSPEEALADPSRIYGTIVEEDLARVAAEEERAFASFSVFRTEVRVSRPSGEIGWSYFASKPRLLADGACCWDGLEQDITERKQAEAALRESEDRLRFLSHHDALTGLLSRTAFGEAMQETEQELARGTAVSILVLDVDGLKTINDTMGHQAGDRLLLTAARVLRAMLPADAALYRVGGDEFCIVARNLSGAAATQLKDAIVSRMKQEAAAEVALRPSLSVGVAASNGVDAESVFEIYQRADDDMYHDKLIRCGTARSYVETLAKALDAYDYGTQGHLERVAQIVGLISERLRLPENRKRDLDLLARLHDIGKVGIQEAILLKPGLLSAEEYEAIKRHSAIGHRIAARSSNLVSIAKLILHHHEHWDGTGYPAGLSGEAIPLECRILLIADAFDAMTSPRPYRPSISCREAVEAMQAKAGVQFDPELVRVFIELFEEGAIDDRTRP